MSDTVFISDRGNQNLLADIRSSGSVFAYDEAAVMSDYKRDSDVVPDNTQPQWEVYIDGTRVTGKLLHMTGIDDSSHYVLDAKLSLQIGEPGSFSFTITPHHVLYDEIAPYKTTINVYQEGVELFRGRVIRYTTDINRQRSVECEGDLAYLNDVVFPNSEISTKTRKLSEAFGYFIQLYDKFGKFKENDPRYFVPGNVSISKANYEVKVSEWLGTEKSSTSFTDARSLIDEFIETFGGYLRTKRQKDGSVALEYISGYTDVSNQTIAYGSNMLEFSIDSNMDDLFTVLIPLGDSDEQEDEALTIAGSETIRDSTVDNATLTHTKGKKWENRELVWEEGVALYGRIIHQESFGGITSKSELLSRSMAYFRECITGYLGNYTIKAVDLHYSDPSYRPIYLGQKVRIVSVPHGIDTENQPLTCMKIDYDLTNPETVSCEFDIPFQPLTNTFTSKYKEQQDQQDDAVEKARKSAKRANKVNKDQAGDMDALSKAQEKLAELVARACEKMGITVPGNWGGADISGSGGKKPTADPKEDEDGVKYKFDANGNVISDLKGTAVEGSGAFEMTPDK